MRFVRIVGVRTDDPDAPPNQPVNAPPRIEPPYSTKATFEYQLFPAHQRHSLPDAFGLPEHQRGPASHFADSPATARLHADSVSASVLIIIRLLIDIPPRIS